MMLLQHIQYINDIIQVSHTTFYLSLHVSKMLKVKILCFITSPNPCFMKNKVSLSVCGCAVLPAPVAELCTQHPCTL